VASFSALMLLVGSSVESCPQNDLHVKCHYCVEWDVKPLVSLSCCVALFIGAS